MKTNKFLITITLLYPTCSFGMPLSGKEIEKQIEQAKKVCPGFGYSLLHIFSIDGEINLVKYLVEKKNVYVDIIDKAKETPLYIAGRHCPAQKNSNQFKTLQYLIKKGANVNAKNIDGETPLHEAVGRWELYVIDYLIKNGADVNTQNNNGETPLHCVFRCGRHLTVQKKLLLIIKLLIDKGKAKINISDKYGCSPLTEAIKKDCFHVIPYLIRKGAQATPKDMKIVKKKKFFKPNKKSIKLLESSIEQCSICLRPQAILDTLTTKCKHTFHKKCIAQWLEQSYSCPLCRKDIKIETIVK
jgi:hypothetical protein